MRKLIKLAIVAFGIRALMRWRKSRREAQSTPSAPEPADDPADELRRKLAESREEDPADAVEEPPPAATVGDRRAEVHEQGRATLDEMTSSDED